MRSTHLPKYLSKYLSWKLAVITMMLLAAFAVSAPASANVTTLLLGRRTCETIAAYALYDAFSAGTGTYLAAFAVDLNGNGVFGEPESSEKTVFTKTGPNGAAGYVKGTLKFPAVPEGTEIAVTAYEIDSNGRIVSGQLAPVRYKCTNAPQIKQIPAEAPFTIPAVAVSAKVTVSPRIPVFAAPDGETEIGGLGTGTIVSAIGRNSRGDWLQIPFGNGTAWIMWNTNALVFGPYKSLPITAQ